MAELQLDTLESKGLIRLATIDPELEYLFRHALVQDAAYESLLKQERRALHRQVGEALEQLYPERSGELAAVLARHFEQAGDNEKAVEYLSAAASYARDRNALPEAYELYARAASLLPPPAADDSPELRRRRIEVTFGRIRAGFSFLTEEDQLGGLEPLIGDAQQLGDLRLEADIRLHDALLRMFHGERPETSARLTATFERVADIARELDDPVISALPQSIVGLFQVFTGDLREGVATLQEAAPLLEQKHDFVGSSFALMALGMGLSRMGRFEEADRASERAVAMAEDGDVIARIDALIGRSATNAIRGDYEAAVPLGQECTRMAMESGATACVVSSAYIVGEALMQQQRYAEAQDAFEQSLNISNLTNDHSFRPVASASMHAVMASLGLPPYRGGSFDDALAEARLVHDRWSQATIIWKRAETEALKSEPNVDQMLADYATSTESFHDMGARPYEARLLREWGSALRSLGRADEGDPKLREALALFEEMGMDGEAARARSALAA